MSYRFYNSMLLLFLLLIVFAWILLMYKRSLISILKKWIGLGGLGLGLSEGFTDDDGDGDSDSVGFHQSSPFISLHGISSYDAFYVEIYDLLHQSKERAEYLVNWIVKTMEPSVKYASFLDVGCGTGAVLSELIRAKYRCVGIDNADAMVKYSQSTIGSPNDTNGTVVKPSGTVVKPSGTVVKPSGTVVKPNGTVVKGNVLDPMQFDSGQFSHILCCGTTIYEWSNDDKLRFFRNCYFWTIAGGYLFVHLVDVDKYITDSNTGAAAGAYNRFDGFTYSSKLTRIGDGSTDADASINSTDHPTHSATAPTANADVPCDVCQRETFVDDASQYVRENERILHMCSTESIVNMALRSGFIVKGQLDIYSKSDRSASSKSQLKSQHIYIFERTL